ncbi:MAG TPA: hypothetical protein VGG11_06115 [Xanthobacteraceae bacterium]|jgi:hypothetical protein
MATHQMKMPVKDNSEHELQEVFSQSKRPERGRYLLQVDRQTKGSYTTAETAQAAALIIKENFPIVQVSVYDSVGNSHTVVEPPAASETPTVWMCSYGAINGPSVSVTPMTLCGGPVRYRGAINNPRINH